ncbi:right-handed parallel beta-helix repeat-containing protein [uncultured Mucilaginibacter sp.]|uniref:right-handed parallel beta-helix repeat-containing protein n=1 Tax=uncultured Mucilaginibacter sp. TaxID=797541 RepID=UPI0025DC6CE7|nr:right-handed parallel beta-helix repeat-containing protein [uncultured Mucilaginibacter sp.]
MTLLSNYLELRNFSPTLVDEIVYVKGCLTSGDGGEGTFYWNSLDDSFDDGGTIFQVSGVNIGRWRRSYSGFASIAWFGAKPNSTVDAATNVTAIINAITACHQVIIPQNVFYINNLIALSELSDRVIVADGATVINQNHLVGTIQFFRGSNITIQGGLWTRELPVSEGVADEHTFRFIGSKCVRVDRVHIKWSPEMGICLMSIIDAVISNCRIENCFRDGIYSHYSANLTYIGNHLENIKDDAMSIHDYGITSEKAELLAAGFEQAGHSIVIGNTVRYAIEGFASIGCTDILVSNNQIERTVNAGINVFNSVVLSLGSTATVKRITITDNLLNENGGSQIINGLSFSNGGQLSSGRAAIFIGSLNSSNQIDNPVPTKRLSAITISNNQITNSFVNGIFIAQVDSLTFTSNSFIDCDIDRSQFCGQIVEVRYSSDVAIYNNKVIDTRPQIKHDHGYEIREVTGSMGGWEIRGWNNGPRLFATPPFPSQATERFKEYNLLIDPPNLEVGKFAIIYNYIDGNASVGDFVSVSPPYDTVGISFNGYISNINQIALLLKNERDDLAINLPSGIWRFKIYNSVP